MSKLMLFQCLAASRPSYEDMFCTGRHIVRDLATCTAQYTGPVQTSATSTVVVAASNSAPGGANN